MTTEQTSFSAVLGVVLANLRKEMRVEQGNMAERMGLSQASYSRLESGKSSFSVDQMFHAAQVLNLESNHLMHRLSTTLAHLERSGVKVVPQLRANATQAKEGGAEMGHFIAGATLGAVLIGLLSAK
jgi:transcriptional regulator with XRE-family HTH domain